MNRINLDRLFRLLSLVLTVVVVVHIFSADFPTDRWPGGQLSRFWGFWKGSDRRDPDLRAGQRLASPSDATGESERVDKSSGDGWSESVTGSDPIDAARAPQDSSAWSGLQTLEDVWYLPRERITALAVKAIPMVFKGNCTVELRRAERAQDLAALLFPDVRGAAGDERMQGATERPGQSPALAAESHVVEATLFAEIDGRYLQVKAVWNRNVPATYRVSAVSFASSSPNDSPTVETFDGLDPSVSYDILSVQGIFKAVSSRAGRSANLLQQVSRFTGENEVSMRFLGSVPLSYEGSGELCQLSFSGNRAGSSSYFECVCALN